MFARGMRVREAGGRARRGAGIGRAEGRGLFARDGGVMLPSGVRSGGSAGPPRGVGRRLAGGVAARPARPFRQPLLTPAAEPAACA